MTSDAEFWFRTLSAGALLLVLCGLCTCSVEHDQQARRKCFEAGGYAAEVHSGRGGWVCIGDTP